MLAYVFNPSEPEANVCADKDAFGAIVGVKAHNRSPKRAGRGNNRRRPQLSQDMVLLGRFSEARCK